MSLEDDGWPARVRLLLAPRLLLAVLRGLAGVPLLLALLAVALLTVRLLLAIALLLSPYACWP